MKKVFKNPLFTFILGVVIAASFSVYATVSILSSQVDYIPRDSEWNVNNVEDAIDDLYNMASANANGSNGFVGLAFNFSYTNTQQTFTVPATGEYKIELWGAQGGTVSSYVGGLGSYTKGIISLDKGDLLYIFVGQKGNNAPLPNQVGSYNGGGGIEGAGSSVHPGCIG